MTDRNCSLAPEKLWQCFCHILVSNLVGVWRSLLPMVPMWRCGTRAWAVEAACQRWAGQALVLWEFSLCTAVLEVQWHKVCVQWWHGYRISRILELPWKRRLRAWNVWCWLKRQTQMSRTGTEPFHKSWGDFFSVFYSFLGTCGLWLVHAYSRI